MKWEKKTLNECCISIADGDHQAPPKADKGVPFITISNINADNKIDFSSCMFVTKEYYENLADKRKACKNDVLYSVVGSFGIPVFIDKDKEFVFQRHIAILRPDEKRIYPRFLYYSMKSRDFYNQADSVALGAAQRTISLTALKRMNIFVPPLETQNRIASILSAYDDLIENNQKQIKLLEEAAQRLYKEWFVDLRFPGHENVKIVDGVPEGWKKTALGDIANFKRGTVITKSKVIEGGVPVIAGGMQPAYFHNIANTKAPVITVSASGANAGYVNWYSINVFASDCSFVDKNSTDYIAFVYCFLKDNGIYLKNLQKGSAQPHVYAKDINAIEFICPNESVIKHFCSIVDNIFSNVGKMNQKIKLLQEARDRLLPKLMSGEIEV